MENALITGFQRIVHRVAPFPVARSLIDVTGNTPAIGWFSFGLVRRLAGMRDGVDEVDIALLDAFQLDPRVGFEEVSAVVGVSAATAARRWQRLVESGRAWVSSAPGDRLARVGALFEAECEPGMGQAVADRLALVPQVFSVHLTTGRVAVYALVVAADQPMLARLLLEVLPGVGGLRGVQSSALVRLFSGTRWRLGALGREQAQAVSDGRAVAGMRSVFDEDDRRLYLALQQDGRMGFRDLTAVVGRSESAVRRRVERLVRSGLLAFRTDFARSEAGWPISVALKLRVSEAAVVGVGRALVQWPEVRVSAALIGGSANLFVTVQLHELAAVDGVVARLNREFPGVSVVDSRLALRPVKSWGRLLDGAGRARAVVPVDLWAVPDSSFSLE
jgi:DNA-binding Lrp family transcriptional regulator